MTALTAKVRPGEYIVSEASGERSREAITVSSGADVFAGTVLGAVQTGTPTATAGSPFSAGGGTVGNGAVSAVSADAGAMAGDWLVEIVGAAGATAAFKVIRPDGSIDGQGNVGTPYNGSGSINFSIADGSTDYGPNMFVPIHVAYLDGESALEYVAYDQDGTNGSQIAAGILYGHAYAASADQSAVAHVRDCEVNAYHLTWPEDITDDEKAVAIAQLAARGIIVRD